MPKLNHFQIKARLEARLAELESGVEIITMVVEWRRDGEAYFVRDDLLVVDLYTLEKFHLKCSRV